MTRSFNDTTAAPGPAWTPDFLGYALTLTPDDVLRPGGGEDTGVSLASRQEWAWIQTAQRLVDQYGADEALRRINGYGA